MPAGAATVTLTWDIDDLRAKGDRISLGALLIAGVLVVLGTRRKLPIVPESALQVVGCGSVVVALGVLVVRGRPIDPEIVGVGIRGGMDVTYDTNDLRVGAFDDTEESRAAHVSPAAWGPRTLVRGEPARLLLSTDLPAAVIALSPLGPNRIVVRGEASTPEVVPSCAIGRRARRCAA